MPTYESVWKASNIFTFCQLGLKTMDRSLCTEINLSATNGEKEEKEKA
jgi:hypothetical protein